MSVEIPPPPPSYLSLDGHPQPAANAIKAHDGLISGSEVQDKLVAYLKTTARGAIVDDILKLSGIITSIENDFAAIASEMTRLDGKNLLSTKFAPKWEIHHNVRRFSHRPTCRINLEHFYSALYEAHARFSDYCEHDF